MIGVRKPNEWTSADIDGSRVVMLGAPLDSTQSYRTGSREGPASVRAALPNIEFYSVELGESLEELPIYDAGDLEFDMDVDGALGSIGRAVGELKAAGKVAGIVGGEHTVTLASYAQHCGSKLVVFDAHLDMRDELYGLRLSHGTFLRRLLEGCPDVEVVHVGGRAFSSEEIDFALSHGVRIYTSYEVDGARRALEGVASGGDVYVSLDLDVVDPAHAPGVSAPEPGGLTSRELLSLMASLRGAHVSGFDVVELCPRLDPSGITSVLAAKSFFLLAALAAKAAELPK